MGNESEIALLAVTCQWKLRGAALCPRSQSGKLAHKETIAAKRASAVKIRHRGSVCLPFFFSFCAAVVVFSYHTNLTDRVEMDPMDRLPQYLQEFEQRTGCGDVDAALKHLEDTNWDVDTAVLRYQETARQSSAPSSSSSATTSTAATTVTTTSSSGPRAAEAANWSEPQRPAASAVRSAAPPAPATPVAPSVLSSIPIIGPGIDFVVSGIFSGVRSIWYAVVGGGVGGNDSGSGRDSTAAEGRSFVQAFEAACGRTHPDFYEGPSQDVGLFAQQARKLILVYLHSQNSPSVRDWCRTVLADPEVCTVVNSSFIFWGLNISTREGWALNLMLNADTYPFLAVLAPAPPANGRGTLQQIAKTSGPVAKADLLALLRSVVQDYRQAQTAQTAQMQAREEERRLREEQDRAYRNAEEADRRRNEERRQQEQQRRLQQEQQQRELEQRARMRQERERRVAEYKAAMQSKAPSAPDCVDIRLRLPHGMLQQLFRKEDSMQIVYDFVAVEGTQTDESPFVLCTNMPQKEIPAAANIGETAQQQSRLQLFYKPL